jgi:hypothetical protein
MGKRGPLIILKTDERKIGLEAKGPDVKSQQARWIQSMI